MDDIKEEIEEDLNQWGTNNQQDFNNNSDEEHWLTGNGKDNNYQTRSNGNQDFSNQRESTYGGQGYQCLR